MIIGIDFDNTIVAYDALFHRVALEEGLIPADLPVNKTAVRDHLRATGREERWTEMQGVIYGQRIAEAEPFPGALAFFRTCHQGRIPVRIISHKTRQPYLGPPCDLHAAARAWLHANGFLDPAVTGLDEDAVFLEETKAAKLNRIAECRCTHFIDDLPELLGDPAFPAGLVRCLFDPRSVHPTVGDILRFTGWSSLHAILPSTVALRPALEQFAARHGRHLGAEPWPQVVGGANNRVHCVPLDNGSALLAKQYFRHPDDPRNRFATERAFYRHANAIGLKGIPRALEWDESKHLGIFEFIAGQRPATADLIEGEAALDFIAELNQQRSRPEALALPPASEACFSIDEHLRAVQRRVDRLGSLLADDELDLAADHFVQTELLPAWEGVRTALAHRYDAPARARVLSAGERCISPSDFGFHNSLERPDGSLVFFDFEYAGWDDPAKLVGDFFCQPEVPVPASCFEPFITSLAAGLRLPDARGFANRCRALLPVYQIKWSCILLNDFTRVGRERRGFSLGDAAASRRRRQLTLARASLELLLHAA